MRNLLISGLTVALLGCGQSTGPVTAVGQSIYTADVQTVIAENQGGGFVPPPPPGSPCQVGAAKYTLTVATKLVSWTRCTANGTGPNVQVMDMRVLTEGQFKELTPYLENLTVVPNDNSCGADKPTLQVTISTPAGQQVYGDSFYACAIKDKPLVKSEALDSLLNELFKLTM
jgi:hypothetical protein